MSPAEVLGVEVPQFVGDDHQVLVPRLVGRTATAMAAKQTTAGTQWDEASLLAAAGDRHGAKVVAVFERLFRHVRDRGVRFSWGRGVSPGVSGWYVVGDGPVAVWTANVGAATGGARPYVYLYLPELKRRLSPEAFDALIAQLEEIKPYTPKLEDARATGFENKYRSVFVTDLIHSPADLEGFFDALDSIATSH